MTKPVRSITIEFERMPGLPTNAVYPIKFEFHKHPYKRTSKETHLPVIDAIVTVCIVTAGDYFVEFGFAIKSEDDVDCWEFAMRAAAKRTLKHFKIYRDAFRRWMWLKKAAHECHHNDSCRLCPAGHAPILLCRPKQMNDIIAREFGRVKVRVE